MSGSSSRQTRGVGVFVLLAVLDLSWVVQARLGVVASRDAPPDGALLLFALIGAVTLVTARPALRGHRSAAFAMVASRIASVVIADVPAFLLGAPLWVDVIGSVAILLTVLGIWWTAPLLSRAGAIAAATGTADRPAS
jgi:hypothetical protein